MAKKEPLTKEQLIKQAAALEDRAQITTIVMVVGMFPLIGWLPFLLMLMVGDFDKAAHTALTAATAIASIVMECLSAVTIMSIIRSSYLREKANKL